MANIGCEICGADNARTVPAPSGGWMDACEDCEADENTQAAIDAQALRDDEAYRAAADAEWGLAG
ncbi:hypothetical protein OG992_18615 [Micromonospora sp. NBC_00362]|uniref:hypothetical protein n=1 Tax=Micromonospora sp. NBC_00362 TaxID=2975975 RepID=UPI0022582118|nr:hypothetical protein [Micromonospora sp. NBC_00362]MCX5119202.1 hypothetical protein [Micromonospora sp. NBC_00362]